MSLLFEEQSDQLIKWGRRFRFRDFTSFAGITFVLHNFVYSLSALQGHFFQLIEVLLGSWGVIGRASHSVNLKQSSSLPTNDIKNATIKTCTLPT
jgi:hypothetical protein